MLTLKSILPRQLIALFNEILTIDNIQRMLAEGENVKVGMLRATASAAD